VVVDTADPASIEAAARDVTAKYPDLNVLIAMADIMHVEDWHRPHSFLASAKSIIVTNLLGPVRLIAAFIEQLQSRPDSTIVAVSSGVGFAPAGGHTELLPRQATFASLPRARRR
jgi:short-subunit dehydrogenase involved in D-alanine esterification of teichoic acids